MDNRTPILRVRPADVAPNVLVCGDPERAKQIAEQLDSVQLIAHWREYATYTGEYRGQRVTVSSHGVGSPGAAVCFEELIRAGAKTIIRVGTCGSYLSHIRAGGLLIGTAAVREDGVTPEMVPLAFPAVADLSVTQALIGAAQTYPDVPHAVGVMRTQALFYESILPSTHELWVRSGVVGIEMEYAALLVVSALRGTRAGGIFVVDGNPAEEVDMTGYNPHREVVDQAKQAMIRIALDALITSA